MLSVVRNKVTNNKAKKEYRSEKNLVTAVNKLG